jgi:hypothetical protein
MMTVLPTAEEGTEHLTEVEESKVIFRKTVLESGSVMWQTLEGLKFGPKVVTVTMTGSKRANGGFNMTVGPDGAIGGAGTVVPGVIESDSVEHTSIMESDPGGSGSVLEHVALGRI